MVDFNFENMKSSKELVEYKLPLDNGKGDVCILLIAPATEDNKDYYNAVLAETSSKQLRARLGNNTSVEIISDEVREADKKLYAEHVIKDWRYIEDTEGNPIPCTPENVLAFLNALDNISKAIFTRIRGFAASFENFVELDTEKTAKN